MSKKRSRTVDGAFAGAILGVLPTLYIVAGTFDSGTTEHKEIYPLAVLLVRGFAACVYLGCIGIGALIGSANKRDERHDDDQES